MMPQKGFLHDFRKTENGIERCSQFMADIGQKVQFHLFICQGSISVSWLKLRRLPVRHPLEGCW